MTNPSEFTLAQAADPSTPAALLGEIATHRPDLRPAVAANPAAYPELLVWLGSFADPAVDAALATRGDAAPAAYPAPVQAQPAQPVQPVQPAQPVQGYPAPQGWGQPAGGQDAAATQQLPTGQGESSFGQQSAVSTPNRWAANGNEQQSAAWGQPEVAAPNAWGQQPLANPSAAWGQQPPAKKSRRGMWIGIGVAGALVLGGGAFAANALWFSKVGGAKTPDAAATQMIEAIAAKDLVAVYGVTSPSEFDTISTSFGLFFDRLEDSPEVGQEEMGDAFKDYIDAFDLELTDLKVEVEELEEGLAKVNIVAGQLTVDADAEKLADATISLFSNFETGPLGDLMAMSGESIPSDAEIRDGMETAVEETFPAKVTAQDLQIDPADLMGVGVLGHYPDNELIDPFLIVVEEGGSWYVSPTLTYLEYMNMALDRERGSLPSQDLAGHYDTPEAAAEGLVTGLMEYLESGDQDAYLSALPLADRRALALYADVDLSTLEGYAEMQEALDATELTATFAVREEKDGVAWLKIESLSFSSEYEGASGSISITDGECFTADVEGEQVKGCLQDIPALGELGIGDLSLVAVEEDGSWYISYAGTSGDASGILLANVLRLHEEGHLTDQNWWMDNLGVLGKELF